jgi:hypothetical protein
MRRGRIIFVCCFFLIPLCFTAAQGNNISLSGGLQTEDHFSLTEDINNTWHEYRLSVQLKAAFEDKADFFSECWIRTWGVPNILGSADLTDRDKVVTMNIALREAYVDIYDFFIEHLNLRIGRQRIAWGAGDKLNPTDNLNPYDLENIWDFGRHLGSDGMRAYYYLDNFSFTFVYIPLFTPALLPKGSWAEILSPPLELPGGLTLGGISDTVSLPPTSLADSSTLGAKISFLLFNFDVSASYVYGRDSLPIADKSTFTTTGLPQVDITNELFFPRVHIVGADLAGELFSIGVWAEAAVFFPEKVTLTTDSTAIGGGIQKTTVLKEPYIKYVVGFDYTFSNGIYINVQYLHGFFHERGPENLHDYFLVGMDWKLFDDKIKISPLTGGIEIDDFSDIAGNYAVFYSPQICLYPIDNAEITIGCIIIEGTDTTTFGRAKNNDEFYLRMKYSF